MADSKEYKTKQRQIILDCLKQNKDRHITVDDIVSFLASNNTAVGKTTVYRYLDKLVAQDEVRRYILQDGSSACFQYIDKVYNCPEHFHLKCTKCDALIHLECDYLGDVYNHILKNHNFSVDSTKTVFYGLCEKCSGEL